MTSKFGISATIEHKTFIVDTLARSGDLEGAERFIDSQIQQPNDVTWTALLGASRSYGDVKRAKHAAAKALELNPKDASIYVSLANTYAKAGYQKESESIRKLMKERGIKKLPGKTWIEVDGQVHEFFVR